ncbi:terminase [Bifidobacterium vansinderenii]|uniref:Terminase n=1 Tax=Bifidobacterium vansinderenii TaxID=1984871 RepID=A0A229W0V2_9BIFI|nr:terminase [Bifidobacterium vansinderenii]OXN01471.1 terminase [Bifidobacterium vansinderenii]
MQAHQIWLENPPDGTEICCGFDGSENDDWTCIKAETLNGLIFTPRYGDDRRATIWNPKVWGGRIPRGEINAAWEEINQRYKIIRAYCDPGFRDEVSWESDIEAWDRRYGPRKYLPWVMSGSSRVGAVYEALRRFEADVANGTIHHDGCPITTTHMANARKISKSLERYGLGKPKQDRKIDAAVTSVLAHEAACDARTAGWGERKHNFIYSASSTRRPRGILR